VCPPPAADAGRWPATIATAMPRPTDDRLGSSRGSTCRKRGCCAAAGHAAAFAERHLGTYRALLGPSSIRKKGGFSRISELDSATY
jgi:hypothetical protein